MLCKQACDGLKSAKLSRETTILLLVLTVGSQIANLDSVALRPRTRTKTMNRRPTKPDLDQLVDLSFHRQANPSVTTSVSNVRDILVQIQNNRLDTRMFFFFSCSPLDLSLLIFFRPFSCWLFPALFRGIQTQSLGLAPLYAFGEHSVGNPTSCASSRLWRAPILGCPVFRQTEKHISDRTLLGTRASLLGARTLLGAPGLTTSSKEATRNKGIATRSK